MKKKTFAMAAPLLSRTDDRKIWNEKRGGTRPRLRWEDQAEGLEKNRNRNGASKDTQECRKTVGENKPHFNTGVGLSK